MFILKLLGLAVLSVWLIKRFIEYNRFWRRVYKFRGSKMLPLVGNAHQIGTNSEAVYKNTFKMWTENGKVTYRVCIGHHVFIMLSDPDSFEALMTSNDEIAKIDDYKFLSNWLGDGLFITSDKKHWRQQRKIVTPSFHFNVLERFISIFNEKSTVLVNKLMKFNGKTVDIMPWIIKYALDVIIESSMGINENCLNDENSAYLNAVNTMCELFNRRVMSPWKRHDFLYLFSKDYHLEKETIKTLHSIIEKVLTSRRAKLLGKTSEENHVDEKLKPIFLDALLRGKTSEGKPLPDKVVIDEVNTFIFAGHDTTSSAIYFTLYSLAINPEVQRLAFEEQLDVMDDHDEVTMEKLRKMKYLEMVVQESLRFYPPVPVYGRKIQNDFTLPDGKIIPKGCYAVFLLMCMNTNEKYFENPLKFDPTRFTKENCSKRHPFLQVPFSAGPRNCVGKRFAMLEIKSVVSKILRTFSLHEAGPGTEPKLQVSVVLTSKNGINIVLKKR